MSLVSGVTDFLDIVKTQLTLPPTNINKLACRLNKQWVGIPTATELSIVTTIGGLTTAQLYSTQYPIYDLTTGFLWTHNGTIWTSTSQTVANLIENNHIYENFLILSVYNRTYHYVVNGTIRPLRTDNRLTPPGVIWTQRTTPSIGAIKDVAFGNGRFVAVASSGTTRAITSTDGINWTALTVPEHTWECIIYANNRFLMLSQTHSATSTNGTSWTTGATPNNVVWKSVAYGNGIFVAVTNSAVTNDIITSTNGLSWTSRSTGLAQQWQSVTFGNGLFVAVSNDGTDRVITSPDGITWTPRVATTNLWTTNTYGNGIFVTMAGNGSSNILTSLDGVSWTSRSIGIGSTWTTVRYAGGLFVAVGSVSATQIITSVDGITWTAREKPSTIGYQGIAFGLGRYVIGTNSSGNSIVTSP